VHQRSGSSLSAVTNGTVSNQERPQDFGWGVNAPLPPGAKFFFENLTTKSVEMMVHSEVYLNKYVVGIAPFSTSACPDCSQNITYINAENCSFLHVFAF